ncbi:hypothetical protein [Pararhizobium sp. PWRC1-1]|uniref:hypothetical protein n=1 Tax=Pararhizobium sp. PWRC1-1 TaxID=2804566 RepID=UPI003CF05934
MSFYAIEVRIFGTVYIKAPDQQTADRILDRLCTKTIDARDRVWFSEIEPQYLPMVSFGTSFTPDEPVAGAQLVAVSERAVELAQRSFVLGWRDTLVPSAEVIAEFEDMPVYSTDLDLTTKAFIRAENLQQAERILKTFKGTHIDLEMQYWRWFAKPGEHFVGDPETAPPLALSSALHVSGRSTECALYRAWPETLYRRGADGKRVPIEVNIIRNPAWPDAFEVFQ